MKRYCLFMAMMCLLSVLCPAEVIRTTEFGQGADTYVTNDNSSQGPDTNLGTEVRMRAWRQLADTRCKIAYIRFDITDVAGNLSGAMMKLAYTSMKGSTSTINVYGLNDGPNDFWIESGTGGITYNTAAGLIPNPPTTAGNYGVDLAEATLLGTFTSIAAATLPQSVTTDPATLDLEAFLKADTNNLVTFFFIGPNDEDEIATKENTTYDPPTLIMPNAVEGGPANPTPADGSTITNLSLPQLCWENYAIQRAKLWFGAVDANDIDYQSRLTAIGTIDVAGEGEQTCFAIPTEYLPLSVPATYTWVVEGYAYPPEDPNHLGEPNMLFAAMVWKFYTSAIPIVKESPADQYKFAGETASFTAAFESLTNLTGVTWYRGDTAVTTADPDVTITTTPLGDKQYSTTLTISNTAIADDGAYTCTAQNSAGASDPTDIGYLVIKRKLAQWSFENNVDDATGVYHGTPFGEPVYAAGRVGQALVFDGVDDYVKLPEGFSNFRPGLTFTVWANPSAANSWARFFDFGNGEGIDNLFITRNGTTNNLTFNTYNGLVTANAALTLNEWQFFAIAMTQAGDVTIYKNGLPVQTGTLGVPTAITRTSNFIGESNWAADSLYVGMMDEMQIYNYALDADKLATMYSDIAGTYCRNRPELDWSGNCVVDLADFVEWANVWLECGLWPQSACSEL